MAETINENLEKKIEEEKPSKIEEKEEKIKVEEQKKKKKKKKKRLLGFPAIIWGQLEPLNSSDYFKQHHSQDNFDLLLIATDDRRAAIVHVDNGQVQVESVKNKPEEINPVKKKIKNRITTDLQTFMGFAMGTVNPIKAIMKRQLKIKGIKTVLQFTKYFKILAYIQKQKEQA